MTKPKDKLPAHHAVPHQRMGPAPKSCQWIAGDPKVNARKCGQPAVKDRPWCKVHNEMAHQRAAAPPVRV